MLIILSSWEAEFRRILVPGQLGKNFMKPHLTQEQFTVGATVIPPMARPQKIGQGSLLRK
jgi:hypothetical protein